MPRAMVAGVLEATRATCERTEWENVRKERSLKKFRRIVVEFDMDEGTYRGEATALLDSGDGGLLEGGREQHGDWKGMKVAVKTGRQTKL